MNSDDFKNIPWQAAIADAERAVQAAGRKAQERVAELEKELAAGINPAHPVMQENEKLKKEVEDLKASLKSARAMSNASADWARETARLNEDLKKELAELKSAFPKQEWLKVMQENEKLEQENARLKGSLENLRNMHRVATQVGDQAHIRLDNIMNKLKAAGLKLEE